VLGVLGGLVAAAANQFPLQPHHLSWNARQAARVPVTPARCNSNAGTPHRTLQTVALDAGRVWHLQPYRADDAAWAPKPPPALQTRSTCARANQRESVAQFS
jgi:hypothetical protein